MKILVCFLCTIVLIFSVSGADALVLDISGARGAAANDGTSFFESAATELSYPSSGTGIFEPYVSIQANGTEMGMGTDAIQQFDNKRSGNPNATDGWTHSITVGDLYQVTSGNYAGLYEFLIDINEPRNDDSYISLLNLEIFVADAGASTSATTGFGTEADYNGGTLGTQVYGLDLHYTIDAISHATEVTD